MNEQPQNEQSFSMYLQMEDTLVFVMIMTIRNDHGSYIICHISVSFFLYIYIDSYKFLYIYIDSYK